MSFNANSSNSVGLDYGSLSYDEDKYYFHTIKEKYDTINNLSNISTLVGTFPEGKKVVVSRNVPYSTEYDYALQSWTSNAKAENSLVIQNTLPSDSNYNLFIDANNSCIPNAISKSSNTFNFAKIFETKQNIILLYFLMQ